MDKPQVYQRNNLTLFLSSIDNQDEGCHCGFMHQALELARQGVGRTAPNPAVGSVVVVDGKIVGRGFHPQAGQPHAEIFALRDAGGQCKGADLYVTLEPCSHHGKTGPCCEAIIAARIARVFIGVQDPNPLVSGRGVDRLRAAGIEVNVGVCEQECRHLLAPFFKHITTGKPLVILKAGLTLDGFLATSTGDSQWITCEQSRRHVHHVRDRVDAIMVGIGTVLHDNPRLTTRLSHGGRDPLRVVVDSRLRIPLDAKILHLDSCAKTVIATTDLASHEKFAQLKENPKVEILVLPRIDNQVDLDALLMRLGDRNIQTVLVEGGALLNHSLFTQQLIDRVMIYIAPKLIGGNDAKGVFAGKGVTKLSDALELKEVRTQNFGNDVLFEGEVVPCLPD